MYTKLQERKELKMEIKLVALQDLKPYYNNPRDNAGAVPAVIESFKRYGFIKPIICDKDGVIIAGHTRYIAAFQLGLQQVPVVYSDMSEENAKLFRIADNKLAEKSEFDETKLVEELKNLQVPENLQAFFFEDIKEMVNFSYGDFQGVPADFYNVEDTCSSDEENSSLESDDVSFSSVASSDLYDGSEEDLGSPKVDNEYDDLYKVRIIDGKKLMKVICPYCGNAETIELE